MAAFATLDRCKKWLGSEKAGDDELLTKLIVAASGFIEVYTDRYLGQASRTTVRDGTGGVRLMLPNYPVSAVASVSIDGVPIPAAVAATDQGYMLADEKVIVLRGYRFTDGVQNVQVVYTAGYAEIPGDIEQACMQLVGLRYRARDRIGHVSKSIGGETVAFSQKDMDEDLRTLLDRYRRVTPS